MLLNVTFPVKHVKLRARYGYGCSTECFPGFGIETLRKTISSSSASTSSSPGTSLTSVAGQNTDNLCLHVAYCSSSCNIPVSREISMKLCGYYSHVVSIQLR